MHDAYELGIEEAFATGASIIEWPEIISDMLPPYATKIAISQGNSEEQRIISIS